MREIVKRLENHAVGNAGLYFVCYRLSCRGWNVMPTARNARGVDVVAYSQGGGRKLTIQVKALSRRSPVPLGQHLRNLIADFVVVCRGVAAPEPKCFVLTPLEIRSAAHRISRGVKTKHLG